jgi:hypothetical protein
VLSLRSDEDGQGANIKKPFKDIDLTMHELSSDNDRGFRGQLGFIEFTSDLRLPRHIHMDAAKQKLVDERILALNGVGLVEIAGEIFATAPGTLVDIVGGVPHTWTACAEGVELPDGSVSNGKFTMVYEYEEPTSFFPTSSTAIVTEPSQYEPFEGNSFDEIRFPKLSAQEIVERGRIVLDRESHGLRLGPAVASDKHTIS